MDGRWQRISHDGTEKIEVIKSSQTLRQCNFGRERLHNGRLGWRLPHDPTQSTQSPFGQSRWIFQDRVDFPEIRDWIRHCVDYHGHDCAKVSPKRLEGLRVIDCVTRDIVQLPKGGEFAALSYVWGQTSVPISLEPGSTPLTIEDSITVVKELQLRYLWVDQYCIDQADAEEKHNLIMHMDAVYQQAYFTIIAAYGQDLTAGLPGISETMRRLAVCNTHRGRLVLPRNPVEEVQENDWAHRGWTFQEALLSRRRLVFMRSQVYFQCREMHIGENWSFSLAQITIGKHDPMDELRMFAASGVGRRSREILDRINEYVCRKLTYSSDSLNAILGIFVAYETLTPSEPVYHLWGLPMFAEEGADLVSCMVSSLLWGPYGENSTPSGRLVRVDYMPSWTWAGWFWNSHLDYKKFATTLDRAVSPFPYRHYKHKWHHHQSFDPDVSFQVQHSGHGLKFDVFQYVNSLAFGLRFSDFEPKLWVTGWTTNVKLEKTEWGRRSGKDTWEEYDNHWNPSEGFSLKLESGEEAIGTCGYAVIDSSVVLQRMFAEWGDNPDMTWTVIVLCWNMTDTRYRAVSASLLLERAESGQYERIGILSSSWRKENLCRTGELEGHVGERRFLRETILLV